MFSFCVLKSPNLILIASLMLSPMILTLPRPGYASPQLATIYVNTAATGADDNTSWIDAYTNMQSALSVAVNGTQIWVAEGTYTSGIDRTSTFQLVNGAEMYGGFPQGGGGGSFASRDPWMYTTTLSCEISDLATQSDNCYHVVRGNTLSSATILYGFAIIARNADGGSSYKSGAGIYNDHTDLTIRNTVFLRNHAAAYGGGIENLGGSPVLENVIFYGNTAGLNGVAIDNYAGSLPTLINALFVGNQAANNGGAISKDQNTVATLKNVKMAHNQAGDFGGGVFNTSASGAFIDNSILWQNAPDQVYIGTSSGTPINYGLVDGGCPTATVCDENLLS